MSQTRLRLLPFFPRDGRIHACRGVTDKKGLNVARRGSLYPHSSFPKVDCKFPPHRVKTYLTTSLKFRGHMTKKNDYTLRSQKTISFLSPPCFDLFFSCVIFSAKLQHIISIYEMRFLVHMHGSSIKTCF